MLVLIQVDHHKNLLMSGHKEEHETNITLEKSTLSKQEQTQQNNIINLL